MQHTIAPADFLREERRILVVAEKRVRDDDAVPLPVDQVIGRRQRDLRAPEIVGGVEHDERVVDLGHARVFDALRFLRDRVGREHRLVQPLEVDAIVADGVADARAVGIAGIVRHGAIQQMELAAVVDRGGVEDGTFFPGNVLAG